MALQVKPLGMGTIGPQKWQNSTLKTLKLCQNVMGRADRAVDIGKTSDPLPTMRDVVAELSNDQIHMYTRHVRSVVARLRQSFLETNEEIRSVLKAKLMLERAHEHVRKDVKMNYDSVTSRSARPSREKPQDGADDLLGAEKLHLLNMKKMLEAQLNLVKQQLQILDGARKRLAAVLKERGRVLDLICNSLTPMTATEHRRIKNDLSSSSFTNKRVSTPTIVDYKADPLGPYTPECEQALNEAKHARERGSNLRQNSRDLIDRCERFTKAAARSVDNGITRKMAETAGLKQQLELGMGENRHAIHRSQRWFDVTERAYEYSRGPIMYGDMLTQEHMDRPIVRVFQRHPGTQLPEAQEVVKGGDGLLESMKATGRNIGMLQLGQARLGEDVRDKRAGMSVDAAVLRMRRRKADHKWTLGEAF